MYVKDDVVVKVVELVFPLLGSDKTFHTVGTTYSRLILLSFKQSIASEDSVISLHMCIFIAPSYLQQCTSWRVF